MHIYFVLNKSYVAKLNHTPRTKDAFYEFTVLDLWNLSILNGHALFKYILDR
jgi:hypothetical protein